MAAEPHCPIGLTVFQRLVQVDGAQRVANQRRLRELKAAHPDDLTIFCAHDPHEWASWGPAIPQ
jgi:hypothetical protein